MENINKNKKYVWIAEKGQNVCDECLQLDGQIFSGDEIPLRPHPNCRCEIKEVESDNSDSITKKLKSNLTGAFIAAANDNLFDSGIKLGGKILGQDNAAMFWNIAYSKFQSKEAKEYIDKNGQIIEKVSDLKNDKLENFIRTKLQSQINQSEAKGIIFHENSSVAQEIAKDKNFNNKLSEIINDKNNYLSLNYTIDTSLHSFSSKDLKNAFGKVDILNIQKDSNGNIYSLVVDVYDFNKNDSNPLVVKGRKIQDANKLENYYNITVVKIKKK